MAVHPLPRPGQPRQPRAAIPHPRCGGQRPIPAQRAPMRLLVLAEPARSPLWLTRGEGVANLAPASLPIPPSLARELLTWGTEPRDDEEYFAAGMRLAVRLAESLGPAGSVEFFDGRVGCVRRV